jgi:hypothetical protein
MTEYREWTAKTVEHRVLEAAETLMLMPAVRGPAAYGNAMPQPLKEWGQYGMEPSRYVSRPSRDAIDRMPETWAWINALPLSEDRRLIYAWSWVKARRGKKVGDFASREGMNVRTLRREITRICQLIANDLNRNHIVRLNNRIDAVSEIEDEVDPETVSSVKYANFERAADPRFPTDEEIASLADEIGEINARRRKEAERKRRQAERRKKEAA